MFIKIAIALSGPGKSCTTPQTGLTIPGLSKTQLDTISPRRESRIGRKHGTLLVQDGLVSLTEYWCVLHLSR
jgi:hypothetical protein